MLLTLLDGFIWLNIAAVNLLCNHNWVNEINEIFVFHILVECKLIKIPYTGNADLNAVFYGPRREESNSGGLDAPSSSSSIGNGSTSGSFLSQRSSSYGNPRKHIIQVSTYQMCVLMLFNNRDRLTYEVCN